MKGKVNNKGPTDRRSVKVFATGLMIVMLTELLGACKLTEKKPEYSLNPTEPSTTTETTAEPTETTTAAPTKVPTRKPTTNKKATTKKTTKKKTVIKKIVSLVMSIAFSMHSTFNGWILSPKV